MDDVFEELRFTGFIHFVKSQRDEIERKVWLGLYNDKLIHLRVKYVDKKWMLDAFSPEINNENIKRLYIGMPMEEVAEFIRIHCVSR